MKDYKILVVDDDVDLCGTIKEVLQRAGYHTDIAHNGMLAIEKVNTADFDMVLLDLIMPGIKGMDLLTELRRIRPKVKVIMITAFATIDNAVEAIKKGAVEYISKPFKTNELLTIVNRIFEELSFEQNINKRTDIDSTLSSISNYIRRGIIKLLYTYKAMRFMEIVREINVDDHRKVVFHLKVLKDAGLIEQNKDKLYLLTKEGEVMFNSLNIFESYLMGKKK
ncbi:MAG: response regulator [Candidatus Magnetoovum sp. WYHC-5]|nr:response regulator [Candidatus Magnetoovum sp. WYHC-5]